MDSVIHDDHGDQLSTSLVEVLDAIEHLGEELAARNPEDHSFQVSVPEDPPVVRILAELINELGRDLDSYHRSLGEDMQRKGDELTAAYNALQAKNEEVNVELEMARKIQAQLVPSGPDFPQRDEMDFGGYYRSMDNIGGDIYDVIRFGRNSYGLLIADVSGHGIPAALITALVKIAFRSKARFGVLPSQVVTEVNEDLYPILSELDFFVTAFFAILDLETGNISYTNCGHHPALVIRPGAEDLISLDTRGRFLGFFDDPGAEDGHARVEPGDLLFFYTDGIIESRNFFDEEYQIERLTASLLDSGAKGLDAFGSIEALYRDIRRFCMDADQRDDQSMFAAHINSLAAPAHETAQQHDDGKLPEADNSHPGSGSRVPADNEALVTQRIKTIYARASAAANSGDTLVAAGLFEALYILAPKYRQIPGIIEKLRRRAGESGDSP
jgi:serine phosphatase RsbU (regulator of sigma subunit)